MKYLKLTQQDQITILTLNRVEKHNAMHAEMIEELILALSDLANTPSRVVIINGEGKHFCAGADISWMREIGHADQQANQEDALRLAELMYRIYTFPKPTIALVHGATVGGGIGLMAACDIAIAADDTFFAFTEIKIGIAPSVISPYVIKAIGEKMAAYYFLTGERFNAKKAMDLGLIYQTTLQTDLKEKGIALAQLIAQNAPRAAESIKKLIHFVANEEINTELIANTAKHIADLRSGQEAKEGLLAFLEKRKPNWCD